MPFVYPTAVENRSIQQDFMSKNRAGRLGLDVMPEVTKNAPKVRWTQKDDYVGLQTLRGLDGAPTRVTRLGMKTFEYEPGVFGEFGDVTETELLTRAGTLDVPSTPIDVSDLVGEWDDYLIIRELDRMESSVWTLLGTGVLQIILDGTDGTQIGYNDAYTPQTFTASPLWTNASTSTPIKDFQAVQQLGFAGGHSTDFGAAATAYMTQYTANLILNNQNTNDFGGRRAQYGATINSLKDVANYWQGQNLPKIVTYDSGYKIKPPSGTPYYTKFLQDGKVIVVGARPGNEAVGNYIITRNANNGYRAGSYRYVIDRANGVNGEKRTPANIEIHRGHNGGPAIYYPSAVLVMTVG
jgi:hypothetical protein